MNSHLNNETNYHVLVFSNAPFHTDNTRVEFQNSFSSPLVLPDKRYKIGLKYLCMDFHIEKKQIYDGVFSFEHDLIYFELTKSYKEKAEYFPSNLFHTLSTSSFQNKHHTITTFVKKFDKLFKRSAGYTQYARKIGSDRTRKFFTCHDNKDGTFTFQMQIPTNMLKYIYLSNDLVKIFNLQDVINSPNHKTYWSLKRYGTEMNYHQFYFGAYLWQHPTAQEYSLSSIIAKPLLQNNLPKILCVKVNEISSKTNFGNEEKIIAMIPLSKKEITTKYSFLKYENLNCTFHDIQLSQRLELQKLKITLENEKGEKLNLGTGQPTNIQFLCQKMNIEEHILRLSSQITNLFPNNTAANFKVNLDRLRNMNYYDYEIGLHSIFIPKIVSLPNEIRKLLYVNISFQNENFHITLHKEEKYETQDIFLDYLKSETKEKSPIEFTLFWKQKQETMFIKINCQNQEHIDSYLSTLTITMSSLLWYILTNESEIHDKLIYSENILHKIGTEFEDTLMEDIHNNSKFDFNYKDRLTPHSCAIYCDVITPHITGEMYGQILQCIPLDLYLTVEQSTTEKQLTENEQLHKMDDYYYYKPLQISYYSICQLSNIHFLLKTLDGTTLNFYDQTLKTYINVNLRKRQ